MRSRAAYTRGAAGSNEAKSPTAPPTLIGVGVDGTTSGDDAIALASLLAGASGRDLMLIAIYEEPLLEPVVPAEAGWRSGRRQAQAMLAEAKESRAPEARAVVQADVLVWRGLRRVVQEEHRDLLVVGSRRRTSDGQVRLGERTRGLLDELGSPLALAPAGLRDIEKPRLERIGVGFDGGQEARAAVGLAEAIARAARATLDVRGVVDDRVPGGLTTEQITLQGEELVADQARWLLDRALLATQSAGVPVRAEVDSGDPADGLAQLADDVDLLVIGSSRSGHSGRVSVGKTGRALLNGAPCPVLVVPRPHDAAAL